MVVSQRIDVQAYEDFVLSGVEGLWELHDGVLVEKPGMSWRHLDIVTELVHLLRGQLDRAPYRVFAEGRVRRASNTVLMPDVIVLPATYGEPIVDDSGLAIFLGPMLLVVEVWSRSTGEYDLNTKLPVYQERGDREIWRIHPFERTLTRWIWQPDGAYAISVHRGGVLMLAAVPDAEIAIDLDWLFTGGISGE